MQSNTALESSLSKMDFPLPKIIDAHQCHLTCPMAPAKVVNLYNEFHRMSQLWRWMKKLKWAGIGQSNKHHMDGTSWPVGKLLHHMPSTQHQSTWKLERWSEQVIWLEYLSHAVDHTYQICLSTSHCCRWQLQSQSCVGKDTSQDIWLLEGGGMIPTC